MSCAVRQMVATDMMPLTGAPDCPEKASEDMHALHTRVLLQPSLLCQGVDILFSNILQCSSVEMAFHPITQICFPSSAVCFEHSELGSGLAAAQITQDMLFFRKAAS